MADRLMVLPGDSEDLRTLSAQLGSEFEIQVIDNANDALWEVRSAPPAVILANIELDGLTGLDIAEILPNFGLPTKLVLWCSKPNPQVATQADELGIFRVLVAPVSIDDMRAAVQEAQQAAAAAEAEAEEELEEEAEPEADPTPAPTPERERSRRMHDVPAPPPPTERSRRMHDVAPAPTPPERDRIRRHDVAPAPTPPERDRSPRRHDVAPAPTPDQNRNTRRPHDVAPAPPDRDRPTRKPHDVAPAPSLAERARRAALQQESQTPAPAATTPDPAKPAHTRQGALILTADNLKPIRARMEALEREFGSQCIMLADRAGMLLAECGVTTGIPTMVLLPLLSTSFSTAGQISQMLREKESSALYMHEGANYDVYCFDVLQRYMLVVVFSKAGGSQTAKIGSVWVYAKRAIRDIEDLLS